jgi:hypothetical protein
MQNSSFLPEQAFTLSQAAVTSGLYKMQPTDSVAELERSGFRVFHLDGSAITDRSSYLTAVAHLFELGSQFGQNWDALADALTDLSWGEDDRIVVLYSDCDRFATGSPEAWAIALEIWKTSVEFWQTQGVKFSIVFQAGAALTP